MKLHKIAFIIDTRTPKKKQYEKNAKIKLNATSINKQVFVLFFNYSFIQVYLDNIFLSFSFSSSELT